MHLADRDRHHSDALDCGTRSAQQATDREAACRVYAASFYESVTTRQAAAGCTGDADITAIDADINAFNDLLATRCGG
jgi:hypothetical protein